MVKTLFNAAIITSVMVTPALSLETIEQTTERLKKGDFSHVKTDLIPLAEKGNSRAQYNLGIAYALGNGVQQDLTKAFEWTRKAAEQNDVRAKVNLASMYMEGKGTATDVVRAASLYDEASAQGDVNATVALGKIYRDGASGKVDYKKAFSYFSKAAKQGNGEAKYNLAELYHYGLGVPKNETAAEKLYAEAQPSTAASFSKLSPASGK